MGCFSDQIKKRNREKRIRGALLGAVMLFFVWSLPLRAYATNQGQTETLSEAQTALIQRQDEPIETNGIKGWPQGPVISAQAAILMDADSGTILYGKNIHQHLYPASTTKMLTCILAVDNCDLDETVTISAEAIKAVPSDGSSIGSDPGDQMPMSECLYAILVASANEIANAVGEHIAGDQETFVKMMNEKAQELGCVDTHFANANGLHDPDHYTSPYDLALIAKAFFESDTLFRIGNTASHHFVATDVRKKDFTQVNKHKLITGEVSYTGIIGGKTGFTSAAMQTLVTGCERDGMRLICVVMKEDNPTQFYDTVTLFDYGFENFGSVKIAEADTTYAIGGSNFYETGKSIFDAMDSIFYLEEDARAVLPKNVAFSDLDSKLAFTPEDEDPDHLAMVTYTYHGQQVGSAALFTSENFLRQLRDTKDRAAGKKSEESAESGESAEEAESPSEAEGEETQAAGPILSGNRSRIIFVNVKKVALILSLTGIGVMILMFIYAMLTSREDLYRERRRLKQMRRDQKMLRKNEKKERRHRIRHRY